MKSEKIKILKRLLQINRELQALTNIINKGRKMTRMDIYKYSKDKEIIGNHNWRKDYVYVRVGTKFFRLHDLMEINMLNESNQNDNNFKICGKISTITKFKIRMKLVLRLLNQTK